MLAFIDFIFYVKPNHKTCVFQCVSINRCDTNQKFWSQIHLENSRLFIALISNYKYIVQLQRSRAMPSISFAFIPIPLQPILPKQQLWLSFRVHSVVAHIWFHFYFESQDNSKMYIVWHSPILQVVKLLRSHEVAHLGNGSSGSQDEFLGIEFWCQQTLLTSR